MNVPQYEMLGNKPGNINIKFKLYLFYNDYETSYTTYINHARWHWCLRSDGLRVGGNRSGRR